MLLSSKKKYGLEGEKQVALYLQKQGYTILERNFLIKGGEIDIIAQKDETIAFVEVKSRRKNYFNTSEVITKSKQKKIIYTAKQYLCTRPYLEKSIRFDVALVTGDSDITYIPHAFSEDIP